MSQIIFNPGLVNNENAKLSAEYRKLSNERLKFYQTSNQIDRRILARRNIENRLNEANRNFQEIEKQINNLVKLIQFAENKYLGAENQIKVYAAQLCESLEQKFPNPNSINPENNKEQLEMEFNWLEPFDQFTDWVARGVDLAAFYGVSKLVQKGFKIEKYVTKTGIVKYRVKGWQLIDAKIKNPGAMSHLSNRKIYEQNFLFNHLIKKGHKPPIATYVHPGTGAVKALGSKAGWLGIAVQTVSNAVSNYNSNAETEKIVGDAIVDVGLGAVSLATGGAVAALVVGAGAPVIVGAAVAFGASMAVSYFLDGIKIGGETKKSISDYLKDGVGKGLKTIAGWL